MMMTVIILIVVFIYLSNYALRYRWSRNTNSFGPSGRASEGTPAKRA